MHELGVKVYKLLFLSSKWNFKSSWMKSCQQHNTKYFYLRHDPWMNKWNVIMNFILLIFHKSMRYTAGYIFIYTTVTKRLCCVKFDRSLNKKCISYAYTQKIHFLFRERSVHVLYQKCGKINQKLIWQSKITNRFFFIFW